MAIQCIEGEFDMAHEAFSIMLDILGGLCFGEAYGFIAGKGDDVMDQIHKRALRIHMVMVSTPEQPRDILVTMIR